MLEIKPFDAWAEANATTDRSEKIKQYADYVRTNAYKNGQLDENSEREIQQGMYDRAVVDGLIAEDEPEADVKLKMQGLLTPTQNKDADAKFLLDYYQTDFAADSSEYSQKAPTIQKYLSLKQVSPDKVGDLQGIIDGYLDDKSAVKSARLSAVDRGDYRVISVEEEGGRQLYTGADTKPENLNGELDSLISNGAISPSDLRSVKELMSPINGGKSTVAEGTRYSVFDNTVRELAKKDPALRSSLDQEAARIREAKRESQMTTGESIFEGIKEVVAIPFDALSNVVTSAFGLSHPEEQAPAPSELIANNKAITSRFSNTEVDKFLGDFLKHQSGPVYRADRPETGIDVDSLGSPIISPALIGNKAQFEKALSMAPLNDDQKERATISRQAALETEAPKILKLILGESSEAASSFAQAKSAGKTDAEFVEEWVGNNSQNYDGMSERLQQLGMSTFSALATLPAGIGALMGFEPAAKALVAMNKEQSDREEYSRLFGDEFGLGFQLINTIPQVATDILATIGTTGLYTAAKGVARGGAKAVTREALRGAVSMVDDTTAVLVKDAAKAGGESLVSTALKEVGDNLAVKLSRAEQLVPLFATTFTRSASSTYGSIYGQLPDTMSHDEKHQNAFGYGIAAGLSTAVITAGMSFLGNGGVEDLATGRFRPATLADETATNVRKVPLSELNYKQAKFLYENLENAGAKLSDGAFKKVLRTHIGGEYKNYLRTVLKGGGGEGFEEALDTAIQGRIEDAALDKNTPLSERVNQIFTAFTLGGILGSAVPAISQIAAPLQQSEISLALDARASVLTKVANDLRKTGSSATAEVLQRQLNDAQSAANAQKQLEIAAQQQKEERVKFEEVVTNIDKPISFDPTGQAEGPIGDTRSMVLPETTRFLTDFEGERAYVGSYGGTLERVGDAVHLNLDEPRADGVTHLVVGNKFQPIDKSGVRLDRKRLMVTGEHRGSIPAGTPYVAPNPKNKQQFALPPEVENVSLAQDMADTPVLRIKNARLIGQENILSDIILTDKGQIEDALRYYSLEFAELRKPENTQQLELGLFDEPPVVEPATTPVADPTAVITPPTPIAVKGRGKKTTVIPISVDVDKPMDVSTTPADVVIADAEQTGITPPSKPQTEEGTFVNGLIKESPLALALLDISRQDYSAEAINNAAKLFSPENFPKAFADLQARMDTANSFALGLDDTLSETRQGILSSISTLQAIYGRVMDAQFTPAKAPAVAPEADTKAALVVEVKTLTADVGGTTNIIGDGSVLVNSSSGGISIGILVPSQKGGNRINFYEVSSGKIRMVPSEVLSAEQEAEFRSGKMMTIPTASRMIGKDAEQERKLVDDAINKHLGFDFRGALAAAQEEANNAPVDTAFDVAEEKLIELGKKAFLAKGQPVTPTPAPKKPARGKKVPVTPLPAAIVVDNEENPTEAAAKLQEELSELATTVPVFDADGRATTLESLEVELLQLDGRVSSAKETGRAVPSSVLDSLKRLRDSVNQARVLVGDKSSEIENQIKELSSPDPDVDLRTDQQRNADDLLDIMEGRVSPSPDVAAKAAEVAAAKSKFKEKAGVGPTAYVSKQPPIAVYKSGLFRNTTEAQLFTEWAAGGFMISNFAEHGYDPRAVSGIPFQAHSTEIKQRLFKAVTENFPLIPVPEGTATVKSNVKVPNMDTAGSSYIDVPVVVDTEGTPIAGVFTNNPLVTMQQIDKGLKIIIPKSIVSSKGFSLNESIDTRPTGKGGLEVTGVRRHPNDTGVYNAGDVSLVGKSGYVPKKAMTSLGNILREPAPQFLNGAGPSARNKANNTFETYMNDMMSVSQSPNIATPAGAKTKQSIFGSFEGLITNTFGLGEDKGREAMSVAQVAYANSLKEYGLGKKIENSLIKAQQLNPSATLLDINIPRIILEEATSKGQVTPPIKDVADALKKIYGKTAGSPEGELTNYGAYLYNSVTSGEMSIGVKPFRTQVRDSAKRYQVSEIRRNSKVRGNSAVSQEDYDDVQDSLADPNSDVVESVIRLMDTSTLNQLAETLRTNTKAYDNLFKIVSKSTPNLNEGMDKVELIDLAGHILNNYQKEAGVKLARDLKSSPEGLDLANALIDMGWLPPIEGEILTPKATRAIPTQLEPLSEKATQADKKKRLVSARNLAKESVGVHLSEADGDMLASTARKVNNAEIKRLGIVSNSPESVIAALRDIQESGTPMQRLVAGVLTANVDLIRNVRFTIGDMNDVRFAGAFMPKSNLVVINISGHNGRGVVDVLLHEYLHAVTIQTMTNPKTPAQIAAMQRIASLRNLTAVQAEKTGFDIEGFTAALTDDLEFITLALTAPEFQSLIRAATPTGQRSLLSRIWESLRALFGFGVVDKKMASAFDELLDFTQMFAGANTFNIKSERNLRLDARKIEEGLSALREFAKVKGQSRNGVNGKRDSAYLAAVEAGDMETAQRMVDEAARAAGYDTLPLYRADATKWNKPRTITYLSPSIKLADQFASLDTSSVIFSTELTGDFDTDYDTLKRLVAEYPNETVKQFDKIYVFPKGSKLTSDDSIRKFYIKSGLRLATVGDEVNGKLLRTSSAFRSKTGIQPSLTLKFDDITAEDLIADGYDGVVGDMDGNPDTPELAVISSAGIKSADPVTRDNNGNVIPLSQRFQIEDADIRYSLSSGRRSFLDDLDAELQSEIYGGYSAKEKRIRESVAYAGKTSRGDVSRTQGIEDYSGPELPTTSGWLSPKGKFFSLDPSDTGLSASFGTHQQKLLDILINEHSEEELDAVLSVLGFNNIYDLSENDAYLIGYELGYARILDAGDEIYAEKWSGNRGKLIPKALTPAQISALKSAGKMESKTIMRDGVTTPLYVATQSDYMNFSLGSNISGEVAINVVAELNSQLPEGMSLTIDGNLKGEAGVRRSQPNVIYVNPELLANRVAGLSEDAARASIKGLVNHELAHFAALNSFTPAQIKRVASELSEDQLQRTAEEYYATSGLTAEEILTKVVMDRESGILSDERIADEWIRMQVEKAANGRTYEDIIKATKGNSTLLATVVDAIKAFVTRLRQRFAEYPSTETAASISHAARALRKINKSKSIDFNADIYAEGRFGDTENFFASLDGSPVEDQVSYAIPVMSSNEGKVDAMNERLRLYNLPSQLRDIVNLRNGTVNQITAASKSLVKYFPKLRDNALKGGVDMEDIKILFGTTAPPLTNADLKEISDLSIAYEATIPDTETEGRKADLVAEHSEKLKRERRLRFNEAFVKRQAAAEQSIRDAGFKELVDRAVLFRRDISNLKKGSKATAGFDESNDVYLTRAYKFFNTEGWAAAAKMGGIIKIEGKDVDFNKLRVNAASAYYEESEAEFQKIGKPYTSQDVDDLTLKKLDNYLSSLETMTSAVDRQTMDSIRKDLNRFKPKKDIDSTFRELLGEIDDPLANAVNTAFRVGMLSANDKFKTDFAKTALDLGLASKDAKAGWITSFAASSSKTTGDLAGLYFDPKVAGVINEMFGANMNGLASNSTNIMNGVGRTIMGVSGAAIQMKTQLGFGYWPRNVIGGYILSAAQGILMNPFSAKGSQSIKQSWSGAFSALGTEEEQRDSILRLVQLNVLNDQSQGRAAQDLLRGLIATPEQDLQALMAAVDEARITNDVGGVVARLKADGYITGGLAKAYSGYAKVTDFLAALDGAIDGMFKANAYYYELGVIQKHFGDTMSVEAQEEAAARKVKLTFAGHSQVIDIVKSFNKTPMAAVFLPFARWKSEVFRTMLNTVPLALEEIKQGGVMARRGAQRLAGFTATLTAAPIIVGTLMTTFFRALTGGEEEERELTAVELAALRESLPKWQRGHQIRAQVLKGGKVQMIDMSYVLPHSQLTDAVSIITEGFKTGEGINGSRLASYVVNDLIGTQIAATSLDEILNNENDRGQPIYLETDNSATVMMRTLAHLGKGIVVPSGASKFIDITRKGQTNAEELIWGEILGSRPKTNTFGEIERRGFRNLKGLLDDSVSTIGELTSGRFKTDKEIDEIVDRHQDGLNETQRRMNRFMRSMVSMGSEESSVYASAKIYKFSDDTIGSAYQGYRIAWRPNDKWNQKTYFNAEQAKEQDPMQKIQSINRSVNRKGAVYYVNGPYDE